MKIFSVQVVLDAAQLQSQPWRMKMIRDALSIVIMTGAARLIGLETVAIHRKHPITGKN
jgi:hypothetical protein